MNFFEFKIKLLNSNQSSYIIDLFKKYLYRKSLFDFYDKDTELLEKHFGQLKEFFMFAKQKILELSQRHPNEQVFPYKGLEIDVVYKTELKELEYYSEYFIEIDNKKAKLEDK